MLNALTVDVEEYFHPAEVQSATSTEEWERYPSRVISQTHEILQLLERHQVRATFYILGWVAERHSDLLREILAAGHELGCHSYLHRLVYQLTPAEFREDTRRAMAAIEDAAGVTPRVYRAPSYSVTTESMWALDILAELGFTHDSSIYPIVHDRYGIPGYSRHARLVHTNNGPICEVPVATVKLSAKRVAPVGGGGYLRLLPYQYTAAGIRRINQSEQQPACIYFHPWEIDPAQPRIAKGFIARQRTYAGLGGMKGKIERLLSEFSFSTLTDVYRVVADSRTIDCPSGVAPKPRESQKPALPLQPRKFPVM